MTNISYYCKGNDEVFANVRTLSEAQKFVEEHGGTYELSTDFTASDSEGFSRADARVPARASRRLER